MEVGDYGIRLIGGERVNEVSECEEKEELRM